MEERTFRFCFKQLLIPACLDHHYKKKNKKQKENHKNTENGKAHVYVKTRSHQREDTGLTRLQSHSSSFEAFSCTIDDFQWFNNHGRTSPAAGGGPARGGSGAGENRAPRTKGRGAPCSVGREEAAARLRPGERERAGPSGPPATRRLRTAGRKRSSGEEARGYSSAVCTGSARAGRAGTGPQHREPAPNPPGRWERGD